MRPKRILLYAGEGVAERSLRDTPIAFSEVLQESGQIECVDAAAVFEGAVLDGADAFVMPGGADVPFLRALRGRGNENLRNWVHSGGSYLGFCAGAYYGCARIEFDKGFPLEVCGERELCFFPGAAIGPAFGLGTFRYENEEGSAAARLEYSNGDSRAEAIVYYNGGCYFSPEKPFKPTGEEFIWTALAHYRDIQRRIAAVRCDVGRGRAVLCGIHPEYLSIRQSFGSDRVRAVYAELSQHDNSRKQFLAMLLREAMLLPTAN